MEKVQVVSPLWIKKYIWCIFLSQFFRINCSILIIIAQLSVTQIRNSCDLFTNEYLDQPSKVLYIKNEAKMMRMGHQSFLFIPAPNPLTSSCGQSHITAQVRALLSLWPTRTRNRGSDAIEIRLLSASSGIESDP